MGRLTTIDLIENCKKDIALKHHLTYNHFPPVSLDFLLTAKKAIEEGNKENWDEKIKMPNGIIKSVTEIIEGLHLEEFLENLEE